MHEFELAVRQPRQADRRGLAGGPSCSAGWASGFGLRPVADATASPATWRRARTPFRPFASA
jgi:hypothetical protein